MEAFAQAVAIACFVPQEVESVVAVGQFGQGEIVPGGGCQRVDGQGVIVTRAETGQARDDQIAVAGVEVVLAVVVAIVALEGAGVGIGGLGQVGFAIFTMCFGVCGEQLDIIIARDDRLRVIDQQVGHGLQGLGGGIGPGLAAPPAAPFLQQVHGVFALDSGGSIGGEEAVGVHQLGPCLLEALVAIWQAELPGDKADELAAFVAAGVFAGLVGEATGLHFDTLFVDLIVLEHGEKELAARIPQFGLQVFLDPGGLGPKGFCLVGVAREVGNPGDGEGIGPEVGGEGGAIAGGPAEDVEGLTAVDVEFHAIVVAGLPVEAGGWIEMAFAPALVVALQVWQEAQQFGFVGVNTVNAPGGIGQPGGIVAGLGAWGAVPVAGVIPCVAAIFQPAGLLQLVAGGATDGTIGPRPKGSVDELGE